MLLNVFYNYKKVIISSVLGFIFLWVLLANTLCKKYYYEVYMDSALFEQAKEENIFKNKSGSNKYPDGLAYKIYKNKKINLFIVDKAITNPNYKKKGYRNAVVLGEINLNITDIKSDNSLLDIEITKEPLLPCVPFSSNFEHEVYQIPDSKQEAIEAKSIFDFYTVSKLPKNYIALPVQKGQNIYYIDDENYPFIQYTYASFKFTEQTFSKKNDIKAAKYVKTKLPTEFLALKQGHDTSKTIFYCAVGDMMFGRGVQDVMFSKDSISNGAKSVFTDTLPILQNNDYTIGNLECVLTEKNLKTPKTYNFKVSKKVLPYIQEAGFDYLMLTNNHSYDYGEEGFIDTLNAIRETTIATSGSGMNLTEAKEFYRTRIKNQNISIISCGAYPVEASGFNGKKTASATESRAGILWQNDELFEQIKKEKENGAFVIVNCHSGTEYSTTPNSTQKEFYTKLCNSGTDIVFGSHPHVLQPVELYNGSLIVWSLGNFIFPGMDLMPNATSTMIIRTGYLKGKLIYYEKYPCIIENTKVRLK